MMKVFPYTLVRISGSNFDDLKTLSIDSSHINAFYIFYTKKEKLKQCINNKLYNSIGNLKNKNHQNSLLNLKRNIYNERLNSEDDISDLLPLLSKDIKSLISEYLYLKKTQKDSELLFESEYVKQTEDIREQFKILLEEQALRNGLLLSSKNLLRRIPSYLKKKQSQFSRNDYKAEQGLLKYLTRIKAKTSPFSTFTNLAIASHVTDINPKIIPLLNLNDNQGTNILSESLKSTNDSIVISHVRLNNAMFVYLQSLLVQHPEIYSWFNISLNPTIRREGDDFLFLINHHNVESFQRMPFSPLLEFIKENLENHQRQNVTFQDLIGALLGQVEASRIEISEYIKQLIDFGFLEFDMGVSGLDPDWDLKLNEILFPLEEKKVPFVSELRQTLKKVRSTAVEYEKADFSQKENLLKEAYKIFKAFCMNLHEAASLPEEERMSKKELRKFRRKIIEKKKQKQEQEGGDSDQDRVETEGKLAFKRQSSTRFYFKPETMFYEDTSLNVKMSIENSSIEEIVGSIDELLKYMQPFEGWSQENQKMVDYFSSQFNNGEAVPLFSFYESYYRDVKKPDAEKQKKRQEKAAENKKQLPNPEKEEENADQKESPLQRWQNNFSTFLETEGRFSQGGLHLKQGHLKHIAEQSEFGIQPLERTSFGMFIQFFNEKNEAGKEQLKGVVNGVFPGFGRMMSRFLHLFDNDLVEELRTWNNKLEQGDSLIENCDASCFNANIHPPLMPGEIRMPGSQNMLSEDKQVSITDILVQEQNGNLFLKNKKNNKTIYTFDLGFQGSKGHSQLFQLLSRFSLTRYIFPHGVISAVNNFVVASKGYNDNKASVIKYPRITYDDNLILQRKRWSVPVAKLPVQNSKESDSSYFLRINRWRKNYEIPDEVFITVFSRISEDVKFEKKKAKRLGRDDYKPQYIDFNNPLLVNLFSKLVKKVPLSMKIEEMLPGPDQLLKINKKKFVAEYLVQWYHY